MPLHLSAHEQVQKRVTQIHNLLQSPLASSLLATHPNDLNGKRDVPSEWGWWDSCGSGFGPPGAKEVDSREEWLELVRYYNGTDRSAVHADLKELVDQIRALELSRDPIPIPASSFAQNEQAKPGKQSSYGMSPKKTHEVLRMSAFVSSLLPPSTPSNGDAAGRSRPQVVDIGAGQGYLTRAIASLPCHPRLLALDGDAAQTTGAERWESRAQKRTRAIEETGGDHKRDGITHKTIHITPETLMDAVDEWIPPGEQDEVVYVALHACGSLTPSILRAILQGMKKTVSGDKQNGSAKHSHRTRVRGAVIVGCCYNLMEGADFPLSQVLTLTHAEPLPIAYRHLAAQIPGTWLQLENGALNIKQDTRLSIRKVVWRAMVGRMIASVPFELSPSHHTSTAPSVPMPAQPQPPIYSRRPITEESCEKKGTGETPTHARLGKINDRHYVSWEAFLSAAGEKMGIDFASSSFSSMPEWEEQDRRTMEMRLATLHVMRCLLGPLVESLILLDRLVWVREQLQAIGEATFEAELVNLFDQETGSGRNVAIVIRPKAAGDAAG